MIDIFYWLDQFFSLQITHLFALKCKIALQMIVMFCPRLKNLLQMIGMFSQEDDGVTIWGPARGRSPLPQQVFLYLHFSKLYSNFDF